MASGTWDSMVLSQAVQVRYRRHDCLRGAMGRWSGIVPIGQKDANHLIRSLQPHVPSRSIVILIVLTVVALAANWSGYRIYEQRGSGFNEAYPFTLAPEFPSATGPDEQRISSVASVFLAGPEWSEIPAEWQIIDTAVLTTGGVRTGIYGEVKFEPQVSLPGPLGFIRCDSLQFWKRDDGKEIKIDGLQFWLLDGKNDPYQVLPLNSNGDLPTLQDIQAFTGSSAECAGTTPQAN